MKNIEHYRNQIICGDALEVLKQLPEHCVHCIMTSPPYLWLRNYDVEGQIGLEDTPAEYLEKLIAVFRECQRVLRTDGTLWINIGDTYSHASKWGGYSSRKNSKGLVPRTRRTPSLPDKSLIGIPWRLAFALQDDGWILRADNIWVKDNAMPESCQDRTTCVHEHVFQFVLTPHYFYDADAIRTPLKPKTLTSFGTRHCSQGNDIGGHVKSDNWGRNTPERKPRLTIDGEIAGANATSIWHIPSEKSDIEHYAQFPRKLVEKCILAGSSPYTCSTCGMPWYRITGKIETKTGREKTYTPNNNPPKTDSTGWQPSRTYSQKFEPHCTCGTDETHKCVILDPFMGCGTTALVALNTGRDFIGIDLNSEYVEMAKKRIAIAQTPLWSEIC